MASNIELEIRAEINVNDFSSFVAKLETMGTLKSTTERMSVMFFGEINGVVFDIRIRVTNGVAEVVIKKGELHAHNRIELSQEIQADQFLGMVRLLNLFGFKTQVGERQTYNYILENDVIVSVVKAGEIAYVEIEKMTDRLNEDREREQLIKLASVLNVKLLDGKDDFDGLCRRLSETVDWNFSGEEADHQRLQSLLPKYFLQVKT